MMPVAAISCSCFPRVRVYLCELHVSFAHVLITQHWTPTGLTPNASSPWRTSFGKRLSSTRRTWLSQGRRLWNSWNMLTVSSPTRGHPLGGVHPPCAEHVASAGISGTTVRKCLQSVRPLEDIPVAGLSLTAGRINRLLGLFLPATFAIF